MTERLFIRLQSDEAEWLLLSGNTAIAACPYAPLAEALRVAPVAAAMRRIVLLVPGETVLLTRAEIPAQQSRYLDQVLAYAVEEQLAEDVTALHLVGARGGDGQVSAAGIRRELLEEWLEALAAEGVAPDAALPETLCLPAESSQWAALADGGRLIVRTGAAGGIAVTREEWSALAALAANADPYLRMLTVMHGPEDAAYASALADSLSGQEKPPVTLRPLQMGPLEVLARGYLAQEEALAPLNLLQGEFAPKAMVSPAKAWLKLSRIAAIWFALAVLIGLAQWGYLEYKIARVEARQVALYQSLFPQDKRIVNAYTQMKNRLQAGGGPGGFTRQLQDLAAAWQSLGGADVLQFDQLRYDGEKEELVVTVYASATPPLENFRRTLEQAGFLVELSSVTRQQEKMQGVIRISGQGRKK